MCIIILYNLHRKIDEKEFFIQKINCKQTHQLLYKLEIKFSSRYGF